MSDRAKALGCLNLNPINRQASHNPLNNVSGLEARQLAFGPARPSNTDGPATSFLLAPGGLTANRFLTQYPTHRRHHINRLTEKINLMPCIIDAPPNSVSVLDV